MFPRDGANWANWWKFNAEGLARKGEVKLDPWSPEYAEIRSKFVNVSELVDFGLGYPRRGGMELNRLGDDESTRAVPCTGTQGSSTRNGSRGRTSLRSLSLFGWSPVRDGTALRVDQPQGPQRGRVDLRSTELEHLPRCGGSTTYHVKGPGPVNREL